MWFTSKRAVHHYPINVGLASPVNIHCTWPVISLIKLLYAHHIYIYEGMYWPNQIYYILCVNRMGCSHNVGPQIEVSER